jgi:hypothetical protein
MVSKFRVLLVMTAVAVGSMLTAAPAHADILYNWFGPEYYTAYRPIFPRRYAVAYAPTTVAYAPAVAYSPVATGCNTCATTTVGYAPYTSYSPVSAYYPRHAYYQPVTSYYGGCNTCGVQTAMYAAPACSGCGVAAGGCASGNCAVNYGAVSSGCSTCGVASAAPAYNVAPTSSFEPTPAYTQGPTPASNYNVPTTAPEGANHAAPAPGSTYNVPTTTPEGSNHATPAPALPPQSIVPRTQVEPAPVAPDTTGAVTGPSLFRGSASQQLSPQMRAVPHTNEENGNVAPQVRPQLVDPQDKTARANASDFEIKHAVYSTPVAITPVSATPSIKAPQQLSTSLNVLTQRAKSQEEIDAEGWAPAKR